MIIKKVWANTIIKNEDRYIWFSVMSVINYVEKLLIWDTGSTDRTVDIIKLIITKYPKKIVFKETGIKFDVYSGKKKLGVLESGLLGTHNSENILAATLACLKAGLTFPKIAKAVATFQGVKRRLEVIYENSKVKVIDDFGHNPEKVSASLTALRNHFPDSRLIAIFEPRTASSRRKVFQSKYPDSFRPADIVYIAEPFKKEAIASGELFSSQKLADDLNKTGTKTYALATADEIVGHLSKIYRSGNKSTIITIMSSGSFDNIHQKIIKAVS